MVPSPIWTPQASSGSAKESRAAGTVAREGKCCKKVCVCPMRQHEDNTTLKGRFFTAYKADLTLIPQIQKLTVSYSIVHS